MTDLATYLATRRSALSLTLDEPGPTEAQLRAIVAIASRCPDHGKLAPWRFEHWTRPFRERLHEAVSGLLDPSGADASKRQAETDKLLHAPALVAVVSTAREHEKIPVWEQHLSAGAACMLMLEAANAQGFEAQWLTAWYVYEREAAAAIGLAEHERIAGLVFIGTSNAEKTERPRPEIADVYSVREG